MTRSLTLVLALLLSTAPASARAETEVELELVLLADASSSIEGDEFELQIGGYARAFRDPGVIAAIRELGGNGIAVTFVQWSATFQQYDIVPWRLVRDADEAAAFAKAIETQARQVKSFGTATGNALRHAGESLADNDYLGKRRVIDITSDEHSNQGPHPRGERDDLVARGITINGLAILDDSFDLEAYFQDAVTGGPDSFIMTVESYADFATAIRRKLVREISGALVASHPTVPKQ